MANATPEKPDDTSIRPVSSLRSHFESIANPQPAPKGESVRDGIARLQVPSAGELGSGSRPSSRTSLDIPFRRNSHALFGLAIDEAASPVTHVLASTSAQRRESPPAPIPPRPVSTGSFSPSDVRHSPAVDPFLSPASASEETLPVTSNGNGALTGFRNHTAHSPPASRHVRVTSQGGDFQADQLSISLALASTANHDSNSTSYSTKSDVRAPATKPLSLPPPVNRADKPKFFSAKPSVQVQDESLHNGGARNGEILRGPAPNGERPLLLTQAPSSGRHQLPRIDTLKTSSAPVSRSAPLDKFEPPPIHHSVARKLRDLHDQDRTPTSRTSSDLQRVNWSDSRRQSEDIGSRSWLQPRHDQSAAHDVRRPSLNSFGSSSSVRADKVPVLGTLMNMPHFPPPPQRNLGAETPEGEPSLPDLSRRSMPPPQRDKSRDSVSSPTYHDSGEDPLFSRFLEIAERAGERNMQATLDFPDSTTANRRKPVFKHGRPEIATKHDFRIFALSGDFLCCAGSMAKVWDLRTGEVVMAVSNAENVRTTSIAFKPSANPDEAGRLLWLGTSHGEISEVDTERRAVVFVQSSAHPRREVIKIHALAEGMCTLDDEGKLHLWPPSDTGMSSLKECHYSFRVPKGHSFSLAVGKDLWIATGKDIRVFRPSADVAVQFDVLSRPLCQPKVGEVTSGALLGKEAGKVFFGHTDGKVTVYASHNYNCLNVISLSLYKINAMAGVGPHLWAGFNTGMVYVYDTTTIPWTMKKDWHAHDSPILDIVLNRGASRTLDPLQVASLGMDGAIRLWDGILQDDWLETKMHERHEDYCKFDVITALVATWNVGACSPQVLRRSDPEGLFMQELLRGQSFPDILVFGFQELVDLEDKKVTAKSLFKSSKKKKSPDHEDMSRQYRDWEKYLEQSILEHGRPYEKLHRASMVGLFSCIFVQQGLMRRIKDVDSKEVKCGIGGLYGNKGALITRVVVDDSSLCFVNCHLAAGQSQTSHRNADIATILETPVFPAEADLSRQIDLYVGGGDGTMILDHEICVLNGDLNYRIDTMGRETIINAVKAGDYEKLLQRDQLLLARRKNPGFRLRAFTEEPITFAPTYKYDVGTDRYDTSEKRRAPAWCDRLLYRGPEQIKQIDYRRHEVKISDHRPVSGLFQVRVKQIKPRERILVWEKCKQELAQYKAHLAAQIAAC